jgi:predicted KAP-like P-loop ATPase
MFLSDHETPVDLLYYDAIAKTLVKLIKGSKRHPISVGIHGDWGAGKSSVLAMAETQLKQDGNFLCLRFNGWQLQGFEDAKAALIETIITELRDAKHENESVVKKATSLLQRFDYLKLAKKSAPWVISAATGIPHIGGHKRCTQSSPGACCNAAGGTNAR